MSTSHQHANTITSTASGGGTSAVVQAALAPDLDLPGLPPPGDLQGQGLKDHLDAHAEAYADQRVADIDWDVVDQTRKDLRKEFKKNVPRRSETTGSTDFYDQELARYEQDAYFEAERKQVRGRAIQDYMRAATPFVPTQDLQLYSFGSDPELMRELSGEGILAQAATEVASDPTDPSALDEGRPVNALGIVSQDQGPELKIRSEPLGEVLGILPFNTVLQVHEELQGDWLRVTTLGGLDGYVGSDYVFYPPAHTMPEPGARLHRVEKGEPGYAQNIIREYFGDHANNWGQDERFYVAVVAGLNGQRLDPDDRRAWETVSFDVGSFIWIPSVEFAKSMVGAVNSGSISYEALDSIGMAQGLERIGQLGEDALTAFMLSFDYMGEAILRNVEEGFTAALEALAIAAVGAVGILAFTTAVGAGIGALAGGVGAAPGAAAGFEVGLAVLEWIGLGFLIAWLGNAVVEIMGELGTFISEVWTANGDGDKLDAAAKAFAEALGKLFKLAIEALVMWAASIGAVAALAKLKGTPFGKRVGEAQLSKWLSERVGRYKQGETALPGPREAWKQTRAKSIANDTGMEYEAALTLLRHTSESSVRTTAEVLSAAEMRSLSRKPESMLEATGAAFKAARSDAGGTASIVECLRLNAQKGRSNALTEASLVEYARLKEQYGSRLTGDIATRIMTSKDRTGAQQAKAELELAVDLVEGRTAMGQTRRVDGLRESTVEGEMTPEYRIETRSGQTKLAEVKKFDTVNKNSVQRNARKANSQLRDQASRTAETEGLIRLDGQGKKAAADVTPEGIASWVNSSLPSPTNSRVTRWVEVLYTDAAGQPQKVVLELPAGSNTFVVQP